MPVLAAPTALSLLAVVGRVAVTGTSPCPSPEQVAARLHTLTAAEDDPASAAAASYRARVDRQGAFMRLRLERTAGAVVAERALPANGSCAELAGTAAVTLAAWAADLAPEVVRAPRIGTAVADGAGGGGGVVGDLGVAALASLSAGGAGEAGAVEGFVGLPEVVGRALGVHGAVRATLARSIPVAPASARWRRVTVELGPALRVGSRAWPVAFDVRAGLAATWVSAAGVGFASDVDGQRVVPAAMAGARAAWPMGWVAPWLEVTGSLPFRRQTLLVEGAPTRVRLDTTDLQFGLGVSVGRFAPR